MVKKKERKLMIEALRKSLGNVTVACKSVGIDRETHYRWLKKYKNYREAVEKLPEEEIDFYENALRKKINKGDTTSIIFALKCKGKNRGWVDRREINLSGGLDNTVSANSLSNIWKEVKKDNGRKRKKITKKATKRKKHKKRKSNR